MLDDYLSKYKIFVNPPLSDLFKSLKENAET